MESRLKGVILKFIEEKSKKIDNEPSLKELREDPIIKTMYFKKIFRTS